MLMKNVISACILINIFIHKELGLLTRGCIGFGKYYNENGIAFGPGIVDSYVKEKEAKYARIIITDKLLEVIKTNNLPIFLEKDIDGKYYCNLLLHELVGDSLNDKQELVNEKIEEKLKQKRKEIDLLIKRYLNTPYIEKYFWLITPYNRACKIINGLCEKIKYEEFVIKVEDYQ
jgi:hypothetical protein